MRKDSILRLLSVMGYVDTPDVGDILDDNDSALGKDGGGNGVEEEGKIVEEEDPGDGKSDFNLDQLLGQNISEGATVVPRFG